MEPSPESAPAGPPPPPSGRRRGRRRAAALALALSSLVALALGELALRARHRARPGERRDRDSWHEFDPRLGWRNRPGWEGALAEPAPFRVRINGQGWRMDRALAPLPAPGARRICFVGDSFTFGYGCDVADGPVARLEAALGPGHEVVNMGTCGHGLGQMRLVIDEQALPARPALVLLGLIDDSFRRALRAVSHTGQEQPRYLLEDARLRLANVPVPPPREGGPRYTDHPAEGSSFLLWKAEEALDRGLAALRGGGEEHRARWRLGRALIEDAAASCRAAGAAFAVVLFPTREGVARGEPLAELLLGLEPAVPVIDLHPALTGTRGDEPGLWLPDRHPGPEGYARLIAALAGALRERGVLAGDPE